MRNEVLGSRYRILERIGEGGMAFVYVAMDEKLGRKVAIKVLHEHMEKNPDIRKRFQLEAQAVSSLDHPNVVKIYDFSGAQSERLWIVTEVIHGKNLAQYVQQFTGGWLHPMISTCVVREILKALDAAHAQGIVHRDIKPENAMMTVEGHVKLMDFGIAKDTGKSSMTLTGTFMGSPSYMSPEQIRGRDVDLRSDLYSLSILFYEIVTGRLPFTGQTTHDVVLKIMEGEYTHPRFLVPSLPDPLNDMIITGMSKDPQRRFQTARAYAAEVDAFLAKAGFDESHIELERYFKDRKAYEERLKKTGIAPLAPTNTGRRGAATTRDPRTQAVIGTVGVRQTQQVPQPRSTQNLPASATARLPAPPPFVPDATWQKHMQGGAAQQQQPTQQQPQQPPRHPTRHPTQHGGGYVPTAAAAAVNQELQQAPVMVPAHQDSSARRQPPPYVRRVQRRGSAGRHVQRFPRFTEVRQSFTSQLFGVLLVGLIGIVSIWGFYELQSRLAKDGPRRVTSSQTNKPNSTVKRPKTKREGTPPVIKKLVKKPASTAPGSPRGEAAWGGSPALPSAKKPDKKIALKTKKTKTKKPKFDATVVQVVQAPEPHDPGLSIDEVNVKKVKRPQPQLVKDGGEDAPVNAAPAVTPAPAVEPAPTNAAPAPEPVAIEPQKPDKPDKPDKPAKGKMAFASEPAAEVYIDGRRYGTTIDGTTSSGFITLTSGRHTLELRRQGYVTHRARFEVEGGEQTSHPKVYLEQSGGGSGGGDEVRSTSLTLRVSLFPSQVTIRSLENNTIQAFTMQTPTRVVQLETGRYSVRIEHKGEAKERELNLQGGKLTFTADFKGN